MVQKRGKSIDIKDLVQQVRCDEELGRTEPLFVAFPQNKRNLDGNSQIFKITYSPVH